MREIILDTETTGMDPLNGHRIIEIGAVELINKIPTGREFQSYLNPLRDIDPKAYDKHGLSINFLKDKPLFKEIARDFLDFIKGAKLVAHNARFDLRFINYELHLINEAAIDMDIVIDTLLIARKMFPGAKASLDALCERFKVDNSSRQFHGALLDAKLLAEVYIELSGGRQTKFDINIVEKNKAFTETNDDDLDFYDPSVNIRNSIIINPTSKEKELHRNFLQKIKNPLWVSN